jgi:hypothetical protein
MDTLLSRLTPQERRELFAATAARMGIDERLIEKDFWVCWMLRRLFTLPEIGDHLTFKGGTSLSKAFSLIRRFSEDIDPIVERSWLGMPETPSGSPRQWLNKIKDACRGKVRDVLVPALEKESARLLSGESWKLIAEQTRDEDPRELRFIYPTVLPPSVRQKCCHMPRSNFPKRLTTRRRGSAVWHRSGRYLKKRLCCMRNCFARLIRVFGHGFLVISMIWPRCMLLESPKVLWPISHFTTKWFVTEPPFSATSGWVTIPHFSADH